MIDSDARPPSAEEKNWVEWTVFGVGCALTAAALACLLYEVVVDRDRTPPAIEVRLGKAEPRAGRYAVPVTVRNHGDETAQAVHIEVTLSSDRGDERADFEIAFLPGHSIRGGTVTFDSDPGDGSLRARPLGYETP